MDIPNALTLPQFILIVGLFALLIGWLVIFAYLALRPTAENPVELMEHTNMQPEKRSREIQILPVKSRVTSIHAIKQPTHIVTVSTESNREVVLDHSSH